MSRARQVLPGKIVMVTRRCHERRFFLHGCPLMNQVIEYLVAVGCQRYDIVLLAIVVMSNHYHLVAEDVLGRHPELTCWLHSQLAKAGNCVRGRSDSMWECGEPNVVELADFETVLDKCAYVLANPVRAGLVKNGHEWIGVRSDADAVLTKPRRIAKPDIPYFAGPEWPDEVELRFDVPPSLAHMTAEELAERLKERAAKVEAEARAEVKAKGLEFAGVERLRRRRWQDRAAAPDREARGRTIKPLVAARSKALRRAVLDRLATFRRAYRAAREAFVSGQRDVLFPYGTWAMVHTHGAAHHPPP